MGRFGLTLHPEKTRLLPFRRPLARQDGGKGPATFDFLGLFGANKEIEVIGKTPGRHGSDPPDVTLTR